MLRALLGAVLLAASAIPLTAAPPPPRPKGPPPVVMVADPDPASGPFIQRLVTEFRTEVREIEVKVGERTERRQQNVVVPVTRAIRVGLTDKGVKVFDAAGKRIAPKDVAKLLKQSAPVLVSADGKEVDPFYLRLAREGTLVVVAQALVLPGVAVPWAPKEMPKGEPPPK
jgi:hypothetical protein